MDKKKRRRRKRRNDEKGEKERVMWEYLFALNVLRNMYLFLYINNFFSFKDLFIFVGKADLQRKGEMQRMILHLLLRSPNDSNGQS